MIMSHIRVGLSRAMQELGVRGLKLAAKWAGEQVLGMSEDCLDDEVDEGVEESEQVIHKEQTIIQFAGLLITTGEFQRCAHFLRKHRANGQLTSRLGLFLNAYSLFLAGEKLKAQAIAEGSGESSKVNPYLTELYQDLSSLYSAGTMDGHLMYIYGVVLRDYVAQYGTEAREMSSTSDINSLREDVKLSPYDILFESVRMYPYNWSAWLEIANGYVSSSNSSASSAPSHHTTASLPVFPKWIMDIMKKLYGLPMATSKGKTMNGNFEDEKNEAPMDQDGPEQVGDAIRKTAHNLTSHEVMVALFVLQVCIEKQKNYEATLLLDYVGMPLFPNSQAMLSMVALTFHGQRDYEKARSVFEKIQQLNPYRLENLDTFSNILYVMECKAELSHLAHQCVKVDKFRSETCCIVGNYYSLKGQHEKSVIQFQRALKVNFRCLSAWTLMGHEYVELHKTSAAVHCYRKAIELNSADYRAWYGLGQAYEMLHLFQYALYYFRKAASLRPADARMWNAVGTCLSRLGNSSGSREVSWRSKNEAIEAYERAVHCNDSEGLATRELARLHREMGNTTKAAHYYLFHLESRDKLHMESVEGDDDDDYTGGTSAVKGNHQEVDVDLAEGLLFVASYYCDKNEFTLAEKYCMRLINFRGPEGAEAKGILRDIRARQQGETDHNRSTIVASDDDESNIGGTGDGVTFNLMDSDDSISNVYI